MKKVIVFLIMTGFAVSLGAQSLANLAKREKERREGFKGRHAPVVRNADLLRVKKLPAVEVVPDYSPDDYATVEEQGAGEATVGLDTAPPVLPSGSGAPSSRRITPRVGDAGPSLAGGEAEPVEQSFAGRTLEAQLRAAKDLVDLLTTKMNALRQQFEFQDAMVPGYVIQQQLDETNQRLVKAQAQQARIEARIAKLPAGKKNDGGGER